MKYEDTYHIPINPSIGLYSLEFRPEAQTAFYQTTEEPPGLVLNQTSIPMQEHHLTVGEKRVNLHLVTRADMGSYAVVDSDEKVRMRACLNAERWKKSVFVSALYEETVSAGLDD